MSPHAAPLASFQNLLFASLVAAALGAFTSCCGVGAVPLSSPDGGSYVEDNGTVKFANIHAGQSEAYDVPVKDSAETDETITSARLAGANPEGFKILSTFPIAVPSGQTAYVTVQFNPSVSGTFDATLELQTEKMGESPIPLSGYGAP